MSDPLFCNSVPPVRLPGQGWEIPAAASFLQISEKHLHNLIKAGLVASYRLGRRRFVGDAVVRSIAANGLPDPVTAATRPA